MKVGRQSPWTSLRPETVLRWYCLGGSSQVIPLTSLRPEVPHWSLYGGCNTKRSSIRMERAESSIKIVGGKGRCWKSWTSLRPERPGTNPRVQTTKQDKRQGRNQVYRYSKRTRADQTPREANKQAKKAQGEKGTEREGRGEGTHRPPQAQRKKGETKEEKEHDQREEGQQAKQKRRRREALTVLSQSTARKVRYLQVTQ